ncbi:MAG: acyl-CoA dehydrogenase family protein [Hyphomonadaceae bacterium]
MLTALNRVRIPPEDEALRAPVRAFLAQRLAGMPLALRARSWSGFDAEFSRDLAAKGWIGLTVPKTHGGGGRSQFARFVVIEELLAAGAPVGAHWIGERQCAPLLLRYGTEAQRALVPKICKAEAFFGIGMSEPETGSDLASVRTRAERTAGGWLLNGSKIWTTHGWRSDYMIALARTSGTSEDRHQGLSQLLIDLRAPGVLRRPIRDLSGDAHFTQIFFENVELPEDALLGGEGRGWEQVNAELAFERSGPERIYSSMALIDGWLSFLRERGAPSDAEKELAGRLMGAFVGLRELSLAIAGLLEQGESPMNEAAIVKDLGTAFEQWAPQAIADQLAAMERPAPPALLEALDYVCAMSPAFSLRGGTREVIRGIIARGLGLR